MPGARSSSARTSLRADLAPGLDVHCLGVTEEDRHPDGGGIHLDRLVTEDLPRLPHHLHLFLGVTVLLEVVDVGHDIEGDLLRRTNGLHGLRVQQLGSLRRQCFHGAPARAGHRLVGRHVDAGDADSIVDRLQRHDHLDRGAVGVGNDVAPAVARQWPPDSLPERSAEYPRRSETWMCCRSRCSRQRQRGARARRKRCRPPRTSRDRHP